MKLLFPKFDHVGMPLLGVFAATLFVLESKRQLRKRKRPKLERLLENASVAVIALPALRLLLVPVTYAVAKKADQYKLGLLNSLHLPNWLRYSASFLLFDYINYLWHVLLHKSDLLWRFHNVHHSDMDMDLSTAWRFHIGENIASVPYRSAAISLIGIPAPTVLFYEVIFEGCTAFHHSNLRLPIRLERVLSKIIMTPRIHGIHHSIVAREANSNFAVIFSWWDRLHRSLIQHIPQDEITIGVPAYRNLKEQTLKKLFMMPFEQKRSWQLPDGTVPERKQQLHTTTQLAP